MEPGCWLAVTVPAHQYLWSRFDEESHHVRRYAERELRDRLVEAGFQVDYLTLFMAPVYPLMRVARAVTRSVGAITPATLKTSAVATELRVVPLLNGLMKVILAPERWFLRRRWRIRLGSSLLALAHRWPDYRRSHGLATGRPNVHDGGARV